MKRSLLSIVFVLCSFFLVHSQNLLENDLKNWTLGTGSVTGFNQNGSTAENSRENGIGPLGDNVILWKATPDSNSNADGGWNTNYHSIDHTKDYRFTVWIKKTNSNNGSTYLGCNSTDNILTLAGSVNNNPYFFVGDLPQLNKWYLVVGFVHKSSYGSTTNIGGIYDPSTGSKVKSLTDFKFKNTATTVRHRSYLYYDTNTNDRQYFYEPRLEELNGSEPSIEKLLGLALTNKLVFIYDTAGNQKTRRAPNNTSGPAALKAKLTDDTIESIGEEESLDDTVFLDESIIIYPNPTSGNLNMAWNSDYNFLIKDILVSDMGGRQISIEYNKGAREAYVDLTRYPVGVYLVNFILTDGRNIQKKIIKR